MNESLQDYKNATATALQDAYNWFHEPVFIFLIALILTFALKWILSLLHTKYEKQRKVWKDGFVKAVGPPLITLIWIVAIIKAIDRATLHIFDASWIPESQTIIGTVAIICLAWFIMRLKGHIKNAMVDKSLRHQIPFDYSKIDVIDKLATVIVIFFTILFILEITGRSLTTIIAFGGVGGLAIAFASQEFIANFFGGLMIYLTQPFTVGDWIILPEKDIEGHVEEIGWYMTRVRTFDKRPIYVPNSIFTRMVVVNPSRMSHRRIKEAIGLRYSDLPKTKAVVNDILHYLGQHPDIDPAEKVMVHVDAFSAHSVDINVVAYTLKTDSQGFADTKEQILLGIADIIAKHGADFASPTFNISGNT